MFKRRDVTVLAALGAVAVVAWSCDGAATPVSPKPAFWLGPGPQNCNAGERFTGGGRVDPSLGKTTFGFNVDASDWCNSPVGTIKGELETVYHPGQKLVHSLSIDRFESFESGRVDPKTGKPGQCAMFSGPARIKDGSSPWTYDKRFTAVACDNGEPGSSPGTGPDQYAFYTDDGFPGFDRTDLTGGNIQAH
jgi:hypothetical protein